MSEPSRAQGSAESPPPPPTPLWIRALGGAVIALMGAGLLYAVAIGIANAGRIGV